jgi:short subunit dehydrogenase-like uncharacterized protein
MQTEREFDVVLWGATGFTGKLVAEYLYANYGSNSDLKWAMAARNRDKLEKIRDEVADKSIPIIIADSKNEQSLIELAKRTKVVCTTVGPYEKYGSLLVKVCVDYETNYCDLTGEVPWMVKMINLYHDKASSKKLKIVHTCGFDSIPSDMGVYFMQQQAKAKTGQFAKQIDMRVKAFAGGISGGTYASLTGMLEDAEEDKSIYGILNNPYSLNPEGEQYGPDQRDLQTVVFDTVSESWNYPFIMAGINTKVVRRSNALLDYEYGKEFKYSESAMTGKGIPNRMKATAAAASMAMLMLAKPGSLLKKVVDKKTPKPGEGPSKEERENGFYNLRYYTRLYDDTMVVGKVTGDKDPGYGSTSKMLAESAIALAKDELPDTYGMLTPSVAMGDALLKRLQDNAGLTFTYDINESA